MPNSLFYPSNVDIKYPLTGVRGIYVPLEKLKDNESINNIVNFINENELNAIVIDIKDDYGNITTIFDTEDQEILDNSENIVDIKHIMNVLEENQIYPIARIVSFKDNRKSDLNYHDSFIEKSNNQLWTDANGSKFINPFIKKNRDYIIKIAIEAAKIGFKDIQLDYVRFPEGFETFYDNLIYSKEEFEVYENSNDERTAVIEQFIYDVKRAVRLYNVQVSADIFGYITIARNTDDVIGIGQDFYKIAENVDVLSSMIYPSHWNEGFFGIDYPNANPYSTIEEYILSEKYSFTEVTNIPTSRPWIQSFTDYSIVGPNFKEYTSKEVQEQINALFNNGIKEYLLWNAEGIYFENVDYYKE